MQAWVDLLGSDLVSCGPAAGSTIVDTREVLAHAAHVVVYFAAHSYFSSRRFIYGVTKFVANVHNTANASTGVVCIMVSADSTVEEFHSSVSEAVQGYAVKFEDLKRRREISVRYHVTDLPGMVLLDASGEVLCADQSWPLLDPHGQFFPWKRSVMQSVALGGEHAPQISKVRTIVAYKKKKKDELNFEKGDVIRVIFIAGIRGRGELTGKKVGEFLVEHTEPIELVGVDYSLTSEFEVSVDVQNIEIGLVYLLTDASVLAMIRKHLRWIIVFQTKESESNTKQLFSQFDSNKKWQDLNIACATINPHSAIRSSFAFNIEKQPCARLIDGDGVITVPDKSMVSIRALTKFCASALGDKSKVFRSPLPM